MLWKDLNWPTSRDLYTWVSCFQTASSSERVSLGWNFKEIPCKFHNEKPSLYACANLMGWMVLDWAVWGEMFLLRTEDTSSKHRHMASLARNFWILCCLLWWNTQIWNMSVAPRTQCVQSRYIMIARFLFMNWNTYCPLPRAYTVPQISLSRWFLLNIRA